MAAAAMFCTACGRKLADEGSFCGKCGAPIERTAQPPRGNYFDRKTCPNCKHANFRRTARYCEKCECKLNDFTDFRNGLIAATLVVLSVIGVFTVLRWLL
jgi:hypothetical protein